MQIQPILGYFWAIFGLYQPSGPSPPLLDLGLPFLHILDPPLWIKNKEYFGNEPFLLRMHGMSKAHYLITAAVCRIPPYSTCSNSPNLQVGWDTHGFKSLPGFFCVLLRMTVHVSMAYDQTIDGRRNREQIWGSYFVIEMIKLSYLGL